MKPSLQLSHIKLYKINQILIKLKEGFKMGNQEIFLYYFILILGVLFVLMAMFIFIAMYSDKDYTILNVGKSLVIFLLVFYF